MNDNNAKRRFNDFVWLHEKLTDAFPGVIIPPVPKKQIMGRFDTDFIETRRLALEKFLVRVTRHTELKHSPLLVIFMSADTSTFQEFKESLNTRAAISSIVVEFVGAVVMPPMTSQVCTFTFVFLLFTPFIYSVCNYLFSLSTSTVQQIHISTLLKRLLSSLRVI